MCVKNITNKKRCIAHEIDLICHECNNIDILITNNNIHNINFIEQNGEVQIIAPIPIRINDIIKNQIQEFLDEFDDF